MRERAKWHQSKVLAELQVAHIDEVLGKVDGALEFVRSATPETIEELRDPRRWREHEELSYVLEMDELF